MQCGGHRFDPDTLHAPATAVDTLGANAAAAVGGPLAPARVPDTPPAPGKPRSRRNARERARSMPAAVRAALLSRYYFDRLPDPPVDPLPDVARARVAESVDVSVDSVASSSRALRARIDAASVVPP